MAESPLRRTLLFALAVAYAGLVVVYSTVWMHAARTGARAFLGVTSTHDPRLAGLRLERVVPGSAAERAGLQAGDVLVAVNGLGLGTTEPFNRAVALGRPGDEVRLLVLRPGQTRPLSLTAVVTPPLEDLHRQTFTRRVAAEILAAYPVLFLAVALPLLFLRLESRDAWLVALLFAGFIAAAPYSESRAPEGLRGLTLAFKVLFNGVLPALFLYVFSVFPERSPLDRRVPWLKTLWLAVGLGGSLPLAAWGLVAGTAWPLQNFARQLPRWDRVPLLPIYVYSLGGMLLGAVSVASNALRGSESARRKSRVVVWGALGGVAPIFIIEGVATAMGRNFYQLPFWIWTPCVMALLLLPLSFAYAVLKHRVLEVPVLLRRSARYLMVQRGALGVLMLLGAGSTLAFADSLAGYLQPRTAAALPTAAMVGAAFGTVLIWTGNRLHRRVRARIDRAFFRSAYDARLVLEELAERARQATSRDDLAALIDHHVRSALMPASLDVHLARRDGALEKRPAPSDLAQGLLPPHDPLLQLLASRAQPLDGPETAAVEWPAVLGPERAECVVPIPGRAGTCIGLLALGRRRSDEPYSREDKRLLASVAGQASISLETIRLAEQVTERLEAERRAAHELELAQQVQRRLLPQDHPEARTLEYAGRCLQARAVGGDYFDFLDLGTGQLGLVLADVSGKGFPAALLMAALQASLRSRSAQDMQDLPRQLRAVNQLLYRSSEISRFATLFIGVYDDASRRLVYANCGHNPPLVVRSAGGTETLLPTAPVLGLLEDWDCTTGEVALSAGDLLAIFTDGVVEAASDAGEEFGEERLLRVLTAPGDPRLDVLLDRVVDEVRDFSGSEQEDDLTLVLARGV